MERKFDKVRVSELTEEDMLKARQEFLQGLQILSEHSEQLHENFAYASAVLMSAPDAHYRIMGMVAYGKLYDEFGVDAAENSTEPISRIPMRIELHDAGVKVGESKGIIVGLVGMDNEKTDPTFDAVALMRNRQGEDMFARVSVKPSGRTILDCEQFKQPR